MSESKTDIILNEDEQLIIELEAEMWATSQSPVAKMIGDLKRSICMAFGFKRRNHIIITNKRVIELIEYTSLWVFNRGKDVKYVLPGSVKEVGYTKKGTFLGCFSQAYRLYYDSFTQRTSILLPVDCEADAKKIADAFYDAIRKNQ